MFYLIQDFRSNLVASLKVSRKKALDLKVLEVLVFFPLGCYTKRLTLDFATLFWPQFLFFRHFPSSGPLTLLVSSILELRVDVSSL